MLNWISQHERERREAIRRACRENGWTFLEGSPSHALQDRVVIGLAMWSDYDVEFFEMLRNSPFLHNLPLEIFDMEDVRTETDFQRFIPGGRLPLRTPILGVLTDQRLAEQLEGDAVLNLGAFGMQKLVATITD